MRRLAVFVALILLLVGSISAQGHYGKQPKQGRGSWGLCYGPAIGSGHWGVAIDNTYAQSGTTPVTFGQEAKVKMAFGGKIGGFYLCPNKQRFDFLVFGEYYQNAFRFIDYSTGAAFEAPMTGIGIAPRFQWSAHVNVAFEPYISAGFGIHYITVDGNNALFFGPDLAAGFRVKLGRQCAFFTEFDSSPLGNKDITGATPLGETVYHLRASYNTFRVGFELPISCGGLCVP